MSRIALEVNNAEDIFHAHEVGWEKSVSDWARIGKTNAQLLKKFFICFEEHLQVSLKWNGKNRVCIKFKNLEEFIPRSALKATERKKLDVLLPHFVQDRSFLDKIRREKEKIETAQSSIDVQNLVKKMAIPKNSSRLSTAEIERQKQVILSREKTAH